MNPFRKRSYVFNGITHNGPQVAGAFYINSKMSAADISDGLSHTAFVSEICTVSGLDMRGVMHYPEGPLYQHNYTPNSAVPDLIRTGACVNVPIYAPCDPTNSSDSNGRNQIMTARSSHPGGVNLLLGDGSRDSSPTTSRWIPGRRFVRLTAVKLSTAATFNFTELEA